MKEQEKQQAIQLRQQGFSYNEILKKVAVSKSTLSLWLQNIGIAERHKQRFTAKRQLAQLKAQEASRQIRITREKEIILKAQGEVRRISRRELWIIGAALYWAEGSKQKAHNVSQKVSFNNSDPKMIAVFNRWIQEICSRPKSDLCYSIYIHRTGDVGKAKDFWGKLLDARVEKIYFKSHNPTTNRKNKDKDYYGLLRIDVRKSTDLNRKIRGWIEGMIQAIEKNSF